MRTRYFLSGKHVGILMLISIFSFSGCKKFLDINENPNNPDSATPALLLPTVEAALGQVVGNSFQIYGGIWSQYWAQNVASSQYKTIEDYNVANTAFNVAWRILYRNALNNAQLIINDQDNPSSEYYKAIAYILKAYAFQVATDAFGDIPLTEALNANEYSDPNYDSQAVVYDSIFYYLDQGITLAGTTNAVDPGAQDMIFQGDMDRWISFANILKLKAYLRLSEINPELASSGIQDLYSAGAAFLDTDAQIEYSTVGGNENPLYNEMVGLGYTQNLIASRTAVSNFNRNNDPRVFKFYDPLLNANGEPQDSITSLPQGAYDNTDYTGRSYSPPSSLVGGRANNTASAVAPVKFFSAAETYFLQAEAAVRGWGTADAESAFMQGIRESFTAVGLTSEADAYIANAPDAVFSGSEESRIKAIITQKYYAMCGTQGFEAWTEWRRTGFPDFFVVSEASIIGAGRMPLRFPYPNSEITSNNNFPDTEFIYTPVWWDANP
ncbi:SusD/RagB family nutrient-binding outer membrane lipoprotein [Parapedobacter tibetensis]|uniref:SusD/RagB family nutrient-binding outer membrane lipoprotein n=1 Tax=Parapedobacter tibetensis TaxID=2972951 RepID=UPI00214DDB49|nr:SusD/RagB family nutrient-binding outer membrane lipoprotein [Parapedobacter tibetensis]